MKEILENLDMKDKVYLFIFGILGAIFLSFYFIDITIKKDKEFIQTIINSKLPISIEKVKTLNTIKTLDLNVKDNKIVAKVNVDINNPLMSFYDQTGTITVHHTLENGIIYLQIDEINFNNLTYDDLKKEVVEKTEKKISKFLTNKLYIKEEKIDDIKNKILNNEQINNFKNKSNYNEEKLKSDLYQTLKLQKFKVLDLGFKGNFIKDIKFNTLDNNNFEAVVVLNGGTFCLISGIGSFLIFLIWLFRREILKED